MVPARSGFLSVRVFCVVPTRSGFLKGQGRCMVPVRSLASWVRVGSSNNRFPFPRIHSSLLSK